jgi:hypothetical protein
VSAIGIATRIRQNSPLPVSNQASTKQGLADLAHLCFKIIPARKIAGIPAGDNFYYHPLPSLISKQKEWLTKIMECLQES